MSGEIEALIALNATGMVGTSLLRRLTERFGTASAALKAPALRLREVKGVGEITAREIVAAAKAGKGGAELEKAAQAGIRIATCDSPEYPGPLKVIYDAPIALYMKGTYVPEDALAIGVVGSRQCTPYGERQALRFAEELASFGITVVSGLARGIDSKAHAGAMKAKQGRTIAVLGSGLGRIYPAEHEKLFTAICERGCAVSEFAIDAGPDAPNFPRRNRIISGLALGILVIEAGEKSGALITADWAMEQGRDVFALPGAIENPMCRGPHALIKQGAKLVEGAIDILQEIPALSPILEKIGRPETLSPIENTVLAHLDAKPKSSESVALLTRLPESSVSAAIVSLVAKKFVAQQGDAYRRESKIPNPDSRIT